VPNAVIDTSGQVGGSARRRREMESGVDGIREQPRISINWNTACIPRMDCHRIAKAVCPSGTRESGELSADRQSGISGQGAVRILSVGSGKSVALMTAALRRGSNRLIVQVPNYASLSGISGDHHFRLAMLHEDLSGAELTSLSQYIRRRWPQTRILVVCREANLPEDPLYDERIIPGASPERVAAAIEGLCCS
jgi:hypothetical protein